MTHSQDVLKHRAAWIGRVCRPAGVIATAFCVLSALLAACDSNNPATVGVGTKGPPGSTPPTTLECLHNAPGCACGNAGAVIQCGENAGDVDGGGVKCQFGGQICTAGTWSQCYTNSNDPALQSTSGLKIVTGVQIRGLVNPSPDGSVAALACPNDPCDPYCMRFPDSPSDASAGDAGTAILGCGDAATLTVSTSGSTDATSPPASKYPDSGLADGEQVIQITLAPGQESPVTFQTQPLQLKNADIYFLLDDTSSMGPAGTTLAQALTSTTGIIQGITAELGPAMAGTPTGTYFGVGRFEDYFAAPYVYPYSTQPTSSGCNGSQPCVNWYNTPFQHLLSIQNNLGTLGVGVNCDPLGTLSCAAVAVTWSTVDAFSALNSTNFARSGGDIPEGTVGALWSIATGKGLYAQGSSTSTGGPYGYPIDVSGAVQAVPSYDTWWSLPRNYFPGSPVGVQPASYGPYGSTAVPNLQDPSGHAWYPPTGDTAGTVAPCTSGSAYPCFRAGATPVIVLLSDAPGHDGPAGQYPHVDESYATVNALLAGVNPQLRGANAWPIQPVATTTFPGGGCPSGSSTVSTANDPTACYVGGNIATPASGGCPSGFSPVGNIAGAPCALNSGSASGDSFASAIALPQDSTTHALVPAVYYGVAHSTARQFSAAAAAGDWWSASGVGSQSVLSQGQQLAAALTNVTINSSFPGPGFPNRRAARDCSTTDDGDECNPGFGGGTSLCINNTTTTTAPVYANASASTYTLAGTSTAPPTQNQTLKGTVGSYQLTTPLSATLVGTLASEDPNAALNATLSTTVATSTTLPTSGSNVAWTSTPGSSAYASSWANASLPNTSGYTFVNFSPTATGTYVAVGTITLAAGQGIQNLQVTVNNGIPQGITDSFAAYMANGAGASVITTTGIAAAKNSNLPQSTSSPSGTWYAGSGGETMTVYVQLVSGTPSSNIQLAVTYSTLATVTTCSSIAVAPQYPSGATGATGYTAACPTCPQPACTAVGGGSCASNPYTSTYSGTIGFCSATQCPSGTPQFVKEGSVNYCVASCPAQSGDTTTAAYQSSTTSFYCQYTCSSSQATAGAPTSNFSGVITASSGTTTQVNKCYGCAAGAYTSGSPPTCALTACGSGQFLDTTTSSCYTCPAAKALTSSTGPYGPASSVTGASGSEKCNYTCGAEFPSGTNYPATAGTGYQAFAPGLGSSGTTNDDPAYCYSCTKSTTNGAVSLNMTATVPAECDYCGASIYYDSSNAGATSSTAGPQCDTCGAGTLTSGTGHTGTNGSTGLKYAEVCSSTPTCAAGYNNSALATKCTTLPTSATTTSSDQGACTNSFSGSAGGGTCASGYTLTAVSSTVTNPANSHGNMTGNSVTSGGPSGDPPGNCTCVKNVTTTGLAVEAGGALINSVLCTALGYLGGAIPYQTGCYADNGANTAAGGTCTNLQGTVAGCVQNGLDAAGGGIMCTQAGTTPTCLSTTTPLVGDGYYGNDSIYSFQVQPGSGLGGRVYYHFALLRAGPDTVTTGGHPGSWVTGAAVGGTSVAANSSGNGGVPQPFLYLKAGPNAVVNDPLTPATTDLSYPYKIPATAEAGDGSTFGSLNGNSVGPVLDCNISALNSLGFGSGNWSGSSPPYSDYVVSEIDGYVPSPPSGTSPATYYLVVDNKAPTGNGSAPPAYQYWLQVGGFDDFPSNAQTYTQPSYTQMKNALSSLGAVFVGVDNSGLSCFQNVATPIAGTEVTQADAQFETRDFMDKLAYDLKSYDTATGRPFVVPVRRDGASCNPACVPGTTCGTSTSSTCCSGASGWCATNYPNAPMWDSSQNQCTVACTSVANCPMNTPTCSGGLCTVPSSQCTGFSGLSCAVATAVGNVTSDLRQNVFLRPIATSATATYTAPGAACTTPSAGPIPGPTSGGCSNPTPYCYGATGANNGVCTTTCNVANGGSDCTSNMCEPSNIPGDTNAYCVDPTVFVVAVQANSNTSSQAGCGLDPKTVGGCLTTLGCSAGQPCPGCPTALPACLADGFCGILDTGLDTNTPSPSYYNKAPIITTPASQLNDGMFNDCLPNSNVTFQVTFQMPFQRGAGTQKYVFDLGIYFGAGLVNRERIVLINPSLQVANYYRYYDGTKVCGPGTHIVWGDFQYGAICPTDGSGDYSQIRFCATATTTADAGFRQESPDASDTDFGGVDGGKPNGGCYPGEVLVGVATANPYPEWTSKSGSIAGGSTITCPSTGSPSMGLSPTSGLAYNCEPVLPHNDAAATAGTAPATAFTACEAITSMGACNSATVTGWSSGCNWSPPLGFNVGNALTTEGAAHAAGSAQDPYLRIRMEFDPSTPGDVVAPYLYSWAMNVDCVPSE